MVIFSIIICEKKKREEWEEGANKMKSIHENKNVSPKPFLTFLPHHHHQHDHPEKVISSHLIQRKYIRNI